MGQGKEEASGVMPVMESEKVRMGHGRPSPLADDTCIGLLHNIPYINSQKFIHFHLFSFFFFPPTLTMMHLRIMLNTYWTPLQRKTIP